METSEPAGLYVHLPFCVVRCTYCDFYSVVGQDQLAGDYAGAVVRDIESFPATMEYRPAIATIFLGGGTPSHLPSGAVPRVLDAVARTFDVEEGAEVTVEANPESASSEKLSEFRIAGANRLSLGVQSFRPELLAMMGRPHGPEAAARAVGAARAAGFENVNVDLICGLPGQEVAALREDLDQAIALGTEHISVYLLETDKETALARRLAAGELEEPDAETIAAHYAVVEERLSSAGLRRYEVSNWARPGKECRHNLGYWLDRPYLGFGASAHSFYLGARRACRLTAGAYIAAVDRAEPTREAMDDGAPETRLGEAIITALRLAEGADFDAIGARYGRDLWSLHAAALERLVADGWAVVEKPRVRLTSAGILWSLDALQPFVHAGAA